MSTDLDERFFRFACRAVDLFDLLVDRGGAAREIARQFLRCATSIGANYAEAGAGLTKKDFIAKVTVSRKESREAVFWLRLVRAKAFLSDKVVAADLAEAHEISSILNAIVRTARLSDRRGGELP